MKNFTVEIVIGLAGGKIKEALKNADGMEHNPVVQDAIEFAVEKGQEALNGILKCEEENETCE